MNFYNFQSMEDGSLYLQHHSCMFPVELEKEINKLAGKQITEHGPTLDGFFGNFINSFHIKKEFVEMFKKEILPRIFNKNEKGEFFVKKEMVEGNDI